MSNTVHSIPRPDIRPTRSPGWTPEAIRPLAVPRAWSMNSRSVTGRHPPSARQRNCTRSGSVANASTRWSVMLAVGAIVAAGGTLYSRIVSSPDGVTRSARRGRSRQAVSSVSDKTRQEEPARGFRPARAPAGRLPGTTEWTGAERHSTKIAPDRRTTDGAAPQADRSPAQPSGRASALIRGRRRPPCGRSGPGGSGRGSGGRRDAHRHGRRPARSPTGPGGSSSRPGATPGR